MNPHQSQQPLSLSCSLANQLGNQRTDTGLLSLTTSRAGGREAGLDVTIRLWNVDSRSCKPCGSGHRRGGSSEHGSGHRAACWHKYRYGRRLCCNSLWIQNHEAIALSPIRQFHPQEGLDGTCDSTPAPVPMRMGAGARVGVRVRVRGIVGARP